MEVESSDEYEATLDALHHADSIPEAAWSGSFDPLSYGYDIQYVDEAGNFDEGDYLFTGIDEERRYLTCAIQGV